MEITEPAARVIAQVQVNDEYRVEVGLIKRRVDLSPEQADELAEMLHDAAREIRMALLKDDAEAAARAWAESPLASDVDLIRDASGAVVKSYPAAGSSRMLGPQSCDERAPRRILNRQIQPPEFCVRFVGHGGWHQAEDGTRWVQDETLNLRKDGQS